MPLVPAVCTQCNSPLEVDSSKECAVCPFCNTAFITEKAINNYNTTNITNIGTLHADVVNVQGSNPNDEKVKAGDAFIKLGQYSEAEEVFFELTQKSPHDYRGHLGLIRCLSRKYTLTDLDKYIYDNIISSYNNACAVAEPNEKEIIDKECEQYIDDREKEINEKVKSLEGEIESATTEYNGKREELNRKIKEIEQTEKHLIDPFPVLTVVAYILLAGLLVVTIVKAITEKAGFMDIFSAAVIVGIPSGLVGFGLSKLFDFLSNVVDDIEYKVNKKAYSQERELKKERDKLDSTYISEMTSLNSMLEKYK